MRIGALVLLLCAAATAGDPVVAEPKVTNHIARLQDADWYTRWRATLDLAEMGDDARDAIPALVRAIEDPKSDIRPEALTALRQIGVPNHALPAIIECLSSEDRLVRRYAVSLLRVELPRNSTGLSLATLDPWERLPIHVAIDRPITPNEELNLRVQLGVTTLDDFDVLRQRRLRRYLIWIKPAHVAVWLAEPKPPLASRLPFYKAYNRGLAGKATKADLPVLLQELRPDQPDLDHLERLHERDVQDRYELWWKTRSDLDVDAALWLLDRDMAKAVRDPHTRITKRVNEWLVSLEIDDRTRAMRAIHHGVIAEPSGAGQVYRRWLELRDNALRGMILRGVMKAEMPPPKNANATFLRFAKHRSPALHRPGVVWLANRGILPIEMRHRLVETAAYEEDPLLGSLAAVNVVKLEGTDPRIDEAIDKLQTEPRRRLEFRLTIERGRVR